MISADDGAANAEAAARISAGVGLGFAAELGALARAGLDLNKLLERVQSTISAANAVNQAPQLGELPEARAVAQLDQDVASGGDGSLLGALVHYLQSMQYAVEAVQGSSQAYQETDESNAAALPTVDA